MKVLAWLGASVIIGIAWSGADEAVGTPHLTVLQEMPGWWAGWLSAMVYRYFWPW